MNEKSIAPKEPDGSLDPNGANDAEFRSNEASLKGRITYFRYVSS